MENDLILAGHRAIATFLTRSLGCDLGPCNIGDGGTLRVAGSDAFSSRQLPHCFEQDSIFLRMIGQRNKLPVAGASGPMRIGRLGNHRFKLADGAIHLVGQTFGTHGRDQLRGELLVGPYSGFASRTSTTRNPPFVDVFHVPFRVNTTPLLEAAISQLEGIRGSDSHEDVAAVLRLVLWYQQQSGNEPTIDAGRLVWSLRQLLEAGSPLMQGTGLIGIDALGSFGCGSVRQAVRQLD